MRFLPVVVVNFWINRQIGDEQLPEDSERNPNGTLKQWPEWLQDGKPSPTGRYTFTSWRLWQKDSPLVESGLLGPVKLRVAQTDLPSLGNERSGGICMRKSFYWRPLRGLVSRRALAFASDNMGGFNLGSASNTSVCAAG